MNYLKLKKRIKKNEGFSKKPYKDKLGKYTIGYGHLIRNSEKYFFKNNYNKGFFENVFEKDFYKALKGYEKNYKKYFFNKKTKELLIEMIFQLGINNVKKFKRMLRYLKNNNKYLSSLEMMNSLWYKQTPERVENLIENYLKNEQQR